MSDTGASLRRKIASAGDLESVVRTMKAMAASNISQYENAVRSLADYDRTVQLGLLACFRQRHGGALGRRKQQDAGTVCAVVFGSDQGLVGQFNDVLAEFVLATLGALPNKKMLWVVGERIQSRLADSPLSISSDFILPNAIVEIAPLVSQVLLELESRRERGEIDQVYLFHNRPKPGALYESVSQRMLPLDDAWQRQLASRPWPTNNLPEVQQNGEQVLLAFIREYLFVSLFRSCAESLASENASRLAAMQRAEKNIGELLKTLGDDFHRLRQDTIDEELFDVVSGFEAYDH
ncbi:F0F1 ATP synthase subunit gamma [Pseudomonas sp. MWU13-2100]|uniref:F0F1 ATP synthase subunit gamma n=1 Tax=Pseudomonas sp. MWU13-2100 TaxID=2935075 RepID=UPI00200DA856|nr:F0F1 ATP synthase subunit gamma [Pseudomonas sp. MWU13-2100]